MGGVYYQYEGVGGVCTEVYLWDLEDIWGAQRQKGSWGIPIQDHVM